MRIQRWSSETEAPVANDNQETTYVGRRTLIEGQVRRKGSGEAAEGAATLVQRAQGSGGVALPEGLRGRFEQSLGADLGGVRVHTGAASAEAAASVGARAYALGQDVHFGAGEYTPGTSSGDQLIAHEVAHTVQQGDSVGGGAQFALEVSQPGDAFETEADRAAASMVAGQPAEVSRGSAGVARAIIQRSAPASEAAAPATASPTEPAPTEPGTCQEELTHDDKIELLVKAGDRIVGAKDEYNAAFSAVEADLAKVAKLEAEIAGLFLDVAMGILIPGLGAIEATFVRRLVGAMSPRIVAAAEKMDKDLAKSVVTGLTKSAVSAIKNSSGKFVDPDAKSFIKDLKTEAGLVNQTARDNLSLDDPDGLFGAIASYDISVTNQTTYAAKLRTLLAQLQTQVDDQGTRTVTEPVAIDASVTITTDTHAAYLPQPNGLKLAIVRFTNIRNEQEDQTVGGIYFVEWVAPELEELVSKKTEQVTGWSPRTLTGPIENMP